MPNRLAIIVAYLFVSFCIPVQAQTVDNSATKLNVAVLTLKNADGVTAGEAEIISDRLRAELFNTGTVNIMERSEMKTLLAEQGFQQSGVCTDEKCMVEMGRILGVQRIVAGSIGKVGSLYLINIRLIDVSTGKVYKVLSRDLNGMDVIVTNLPGISRELVGQTVEASKPQSSLIPADIMTKPTPQPVSVPAKNVANPAQGQASPQNQDTRPLLIGIHLGACFFPGETQLNLPDHNPATSFNSGFNKVTSSAVTMPDIKLVMLINRYLSVEAGIGYGIWQQNDSEYTGDTSYSQTQSYTMFSIIGGFGVSIPVSIMRFNAGIRFGFNSLNNTEKAAVTEPGTTTSIDAMYQVKTNTVALTFGGRAGAEILLTKQISINLDLLYMYTKFNSATMYYNAKYWETASQEKLEITPPALGGELGLSFYF